MGNFTYNKQYKVSDIKRELERVESTVDITEHVTTEWHIRRKSDDVLVGIIRNDPKKRRDMADSVRYTGVFGDYYETYHTEIIIVDASEL